MTKPVELKSRAEILNAKCVEVCRELLAKAEHGFIQTVFVVAFAPGGDYEIMISESVDMLKKVGALERLKADYLAGKG